MSERLRHLHRLLRRLAGVHRHEHHPGHPCRHCTGQGFAIYASNPKDIVRM